LPASFYSIASSSEQQRSSRSLSLVAAVVAVAAAAVAAVAVAAVVAAAVVEAVAVALVAAAAPLLQLNSKSISYASLRRLSASRPTTSRLAAA
jgi:O-antigen/teichoic acid export membrane protein